MALYAPPYYDALDATARDSAAVVVPLVLDLVRPQSVLDVGCGGGRWLEAFVAHGVDDVAGVDGDWVDPGRLPFPPDRFRVADLARPLRLGRTFDLAVSLEVAEHLPEAAADAFVGTLVAHAPVVLFSAAIPLQGGTGHVNEQWPAYWAERFGRHGYARADVLRPAVWDDERVAWWYAANLFVFVRADALGAYPRLAAAVDAGCPVLPAVHPRMYRERIGGMHDHFADVVAWAEGLQQEVDALRALRAGTVSPVAALRALPRLALHAVRRRLRRG